MQSVCHAWLEEREPGSFAIETFDSTRCYCLVIRESGLRGLSRGPARKAQDPVLTETERTSGG